MYYSKAPETKGVVMGLEMVWKHFKAKLLAGLGHFLPECMWLNFKPNSNSTTNICDYLNNNKVRDNLRDRVKSPLGQI